MFDRNSDRRRNKVNGLFVAVLIVAALYFGREIFIPLALAGLVAFLLAPVATRLERWGVQRTIAGLLVIGLSFGSICAIGWVVLGQVYNLAVELPQYQQNVTKKIDTLHLHSAGRLTSTVQMLTDVSKQISSGSSEEPVPTSTVATVRHRRAAVTPALLGNDPARKAGEPVPVRVEEPETSLISLAAQDIQPLIHPLTTAFVVVIFVIFMLLARDDLRDRAVRLIGSSRIHITTVAMTDAGARVSRYLLMQFFVNVTYGGIVGLALWAIGVPHPLLWAVTTALLRFIPYIGILAAGAGPVLVALAVSPNWATVAWTFGLYVVMELLSANAIEPFLYGSSTGVSALAILVAAIFWTWLWGIAGLLLSTPLTVCLIVIGRHVPRLEFIGVMFGEESVLDPPQRLYQRILASDSQDASKLMDDELKSRSREAVYDNVLIPALSLIEDARHSEELESDRAEHALHRIEELVEEHWTTPPVVSSPDTREQIACVAVRDFADEISCQLLGHVVSDTYQVQVLAAELLSADVIAAITASRPRVICVVGIPPQAIRHVRLRCHQLRARFPETIVVACVLSIECDLPNIRSRIPLEDAQHVVCSLQQAREYLTELANPGNAQAPAPRLSPKVDPSSEDHRDSPPLDETKEEIFDQIASSLAKAFEAPIAIINVHDASGAFWRSQCGLSKEEIGPGSALQSSLLCKESTLQGKCVIVPDTSEDPRFRDDPTLVAMGIRFFAGAPILAPDGREIGSLCVLDTRPRKVSDQQSDSLKALAESVMNAIELRSTASPHTEPEYETPTVASSGAAGRSTSPSR